MQIEIEVDREPGQPHFVDLKPQALTFRGFEPRAAIFDGKQSSRELLAALDGLPEADFRLFASKSVVILQFEEFAIDSWRRHFQRVARRNHVFDVEDGADLNGNLLAVAERDTARFIQENPDNTLALIALEFDFDNLETFGFGDANGNGRDAVL